MNLIIFILLVAAFLFAFRWATGKFLTSEQRTKLKYGLWAAAGFLLLWMVVIIIR